MKPTAIVTGGSGFVGGHLIRHLLEQKRYGKIINLDICPPEGDSGDDDTVHYLEWDLRKSRDAGPLRSMGCGEDTHIYNLAAICRIPGYPDRDYFETNILGAEQVTALAEELGCRNIIFTSSVAPYGASEELKTEESVPQPDNPYGSSKLVAEYIHRAWMQRDPGQRHLTILRPGIIFGPREQANFTRLYRSLRKGYFVFPGRKDTRKACVYVKDVARACDHFAFQPDGFQLYNLVYESAPTIETICRALTRHTDAGKARFTMPGAILVGAAYLIKGVGKLLRKEFSGIHPDRVRKVMISTNISGTKLTRSSFNLSYTLEDGIADWVEECGREIC